MSVNSKGEKYSNILERFNDALAEIQDEHGMRQVDVARALDMDQGAISKARRGETKGISDRILFGMQRRFGLSRTWVVFGQGEKYVATTEPVTGTRERPEAFWLGKDKIQPQPPDSGLVDVLRKALQDAQEKIRLLEQQVASLVQDNQRLRGGS